MDRIETTHPVKSDDEWAKLISEAVSSILDKMRLSDEFLNRPIKSLFDTNIMESGPCNKNMGRYLKASLCDFEDGGHNTIVQISIESYPIDDNCDKDTLNALSELIMGKGQYQKNKSDYKSAIKHLYIAGLTQKKISDVTGLSQAYVSKLLKD